MKCIECDLYDEYREVCTLTLNDIKYPKKERECNDFFNSDFEQIKEVCEWDTSDSEGKYMFGCGISYITPTNAVRRYKVCPYCGKPIKIKGE